MEKLSVNGKTFDEIFEQRGKQIQPQTMKNGNIYLLDQNGKFEWNWLIIFNKLKNQSVWSCFELCNDVSYDDKPFLFATSHLSEVTSFHEATPDQIALLNLYKSQSK